MNRIKINLLSLFASIQAMSGKVPLQTPQFGYEKKGGRLREKQRPHRSKVQAKAKCRRKMTQESKRRNRGLNKQRIR